jgi:hypothetical protein
MFVDYLKSFFGVVGLADIPTIATKNVRNECADLTIVVDYQCVREPVHDRNYITRLLRCDRFYFLAVQFENNFVFRKFELLREATSIAAWDQTSKYISPF